MKNRGEEEIERLCAYCENAVLIRESEVCICLLQGAVAASDCCKKYKPDLLKLAPRARIVPEDDGTVMIDI